MNVIQQWKDRLRQSLWRESTPSSPPLARHLRRFGKIAYVVGRDLSEGRLSLQAMGLVYTTLLSLVPLLAVSFSVLKAFGVHNQIEPLLLGFLAPLGDKSTDVAARIIEFVENIRAGVLGGVGLLLLIYTVTSLLQKIEGAFNDAWHVHQSRSLLQRFSKYLSVLTIGPVLVFAALAITASLASASIVQYLLSGPGFGPLLTLTAKLLPFLLVIGAFTFIYVFVPNTRVALPSALVGGVVAGILWESTGWLFAYFIATSTRYAAIYSGFAILIFFMIWIYLSWLILLIGTSVAFYHQHREYLTLERRDQNYSQRAREAVTLATLALIVRRYFEGSTPLDRDALIDALHVPADALDPVLEIFEQSGLLARTDDTPARYIPARAPEGVTLREVLDYLRTAGTQLGAAQLGAARPWTDMIEQAINDRLGNASLRELALEPVAAPQRTPRALG